MLNKYNISKNNKNLEILFYFFFYARFLNFIFMRQNSWIRVYFLFLTRHNHKFTWKPFIIKYFFFLRKLSAGIFPEINYIILVTIDLCKFLITFNSVLQILITSKKWNICIGSKLKYANTSKILMQTLPFFGYINQWFAYMMYSNFHKERFVVISVVEINKTYL